jgi:carboxymethylenebutenolidase
MKKIPVCLCLIFLTGRVLAQPAMNCCTSATESFARLAGNPVFSMYHADPLPFVFVSRDAQPVQYPTPDGGNARALVWKANSGSQDWLVVFHEWWGLNDYVKKQSERLWNDLGINVIALDLYDGKVASTRDSAVKYVQAVKTDRAISIIEGAFTYLGKDARIFTIGWCFGGGWSMQATLLAGTQASGCVMYYGMPEKSADRLKTLHADVLGIFANKDQGITPAVVDTFAVQMAAARKNLEIHRYETVHAFANPSNPDYNETDAENAYKYTIAFLKSRL